MPNQSLLSIDMCIHVHMHIHVHEQHHPPCAHVLTYTSTHKLWLLIAAPILLQHNVSCLPFLYSLWHGYLILHEAYTFTDYLYPAMYTSTFSTTMAPTLQSRPPESGDYLVTLLFKLELCLLKGRRLENCPELLDFYDIFLYSFIQS